MKAMLKPKLAIAVAMVLLTCAAAVVYHNKGIAPVSADTILLLLPDSLSDKDIQVQVWLDAAAEEGFHLQVIPDSALLDPMFAIKAAGLIVPDQIHRHANDALVGALHHYVQQGGALMLVYDACTWDLNGRYATRSSRLSDLAGVDYALYDRFGTDSILSGNVWGSTQAMQDLGIPPGAFAPIKEKRQSPPLKRVAMHGPHSADDRQVLVGYLYGELEYPSFQTTGEYQGKALLQTTNGIVAGEKDHGAGRVLFVNLPLGYLTTRTDGMLLHSFLHYFAEEMLQLPHLANVPDGIGGVVMNWHIDAASALKPLTMLRKAGIFNNGPFSADFTAGPDVDEFHDGKGLNLQNDAESRSWVRFLIEHGNEVGSHGGWIHNYFGRNLSDSNQESFQQYLELNKKTIEESTGHPVHEYSAPLGNQPAWVTRWLEKNNVVAYYFAGDSGMGPTRVYRDNGRDGDRIWAFPILHFGTEASLEEMHMGSISEAAVQNWLTNVADFTSGKHVVRLVYSHPLGASRYIETLQTWFQHTRELTGEGRFRWYTMSQAANFLNERQEVTWSIQHRGANSVLTASHHRTLEHEAWIFPDSKYGQPRVTKGFADIHDQDGYWIVAAKDCKNLNVSLAERQTSNANPQAGN
ncbi:MAG TPA: hypothetical protein VNX88_02960 [Terriglobales bacterium]|jgi:hypothetical protein|nr:hypothetical protein [Terriglobales bacterium]